MYGIITRIRKFDEIWLKCIKLFAVRVALSLFCYFSCLSMLLLITECPLKWLPALPLKQYRYWRRCTPKGKIFTIPNPVLCFLQWLFTLSVYCFSTCWYISMRWKLLVCKQLVLCFFCSWHVHLDKFYLLVTYLSWRGPNELIFYQLFLEFTK